MTRTCVYCGGEAQLDSSGDVDVWLVPWGRSGCDHLPPDGGRAALRARIDSFPAEYLDPTPPGSVVRCKHFVGDRQIPCPPMCPYQSWPTGMFRRTLILGRWQLRSA